ncbi:hypothetical protein C8Q80DRAFT_1275951 [Daedaleopsis nitida]|nr:hypothetical protein C8Q80DRAFT_1275951 [Daedaleopsis nitida]
MKGSGRKDKGKKPTTVAVPRMLQPSTTTRRGLPSPASNSKASSSSAPFSSSSAPSSSSSASNSHRRGQIPSETNLGATGQDSHIPESDTSATAGHGKRQREDDSHTAEAEQARKKKLRKILKAMKRVVETRKVSTEIENYHDQARLVPRLINPFLDPRGVLMYGRAHDDGAESPCPEDSDSDSDQELDEDEACKKQDRRDEYAQHCELLAQYNALQLIIPDLADDIALLDDEQVDVISAYIKYESQKARTTDFSHVSERVFQYIPRTSFFRTPLDMPTEKWQCGWEGFVTAYLLCPPPLRDRFKADWQQLCDDIKNPESDITIVSDDFPLCLFNIDAIRKKDQTHGPLTGFLRSDLMKLVFKSLWTGPISTKRDSARPKNTPGKPSLSQKYDMKIVTPRMLAYVAVLLRHSLTTREWANDDHQFHNVEFFDKMVALFDEPLSPWASETLEWEVFGIVPRARDAHKNKCRETIAQLARKYNKAARLAAQQGPTYTAVTESTPAPFNADSDNDVPIEKGRTPDGDDNNDEDSQPSPTETSHAAEHEP